MEAFSKLNHHYQPLHLSLPHHRPLFSRPISSITFRTSPLKAKSSPIIASSSSSTSSSSGPLYSNPRNADTPLVETPKPSLIKLTCIAATAVALFFSRFAQKPLIAAPIGQPTSFEAATETSNAISDEEKERNIEEYLISHPDDVASLRSLMEIKIKNRKLNEAIEVIDRLIQIEPNEAEWPLLKAHLYSYSGESELAKLGFEDILSKDPLRVEAYHGLVMAVSQLESGGELSELMKRIEAAMEKCKKEKKKDDLRDFKLLIAQIRVVEGNYNEALKVYQELVKEEPRDFRPYLCQGIIYTLLRKKDEAEKQFQKYKRLVPKGHPYASYFDDNVLATKVFSQMGEKQTAGSKS